MLRHEGGGPDTGRQEAPHAHQVLADPSGNWLVSVDLGTDSVRVCALDPATGALRLHGETALRPGIGPRHLAFHPSGALAYVLGELEPVLAVCRWDAATGRLDVLGETPVLPEHETADEAVRTYPSEVVVARDGRFRGPPTAGTTASPCSPSTRAVRRRPGGHRRLRWPLAARPHPRPERAVAVRGQ